MEVPVGPAVARDDRLARAAPARPGRPPRKSTSSTACGRLAADLGGVAQAERLEHGDAVRRDLDAGADLAERRRLLEDPHPRPPLRQRRRRGEPADPGADHRDLPSLEPHPIPPMSAGI